MSRTPTNNPDANNPAAVSAPKPISFCDELCILLARVAEAERFHNERPESKRRSIPTTTVSTDVASRADVAAASTAPAPAASLSAQMPGVSSDAEMWKYIRERVIEFWNDDAGTDTEKYTRCKEWLAILYLWDVNLTWDEVNIDARMRRANLGRMNEERLEKIPGLVREARLIQLKNNPSNPNETYQCFVFFKDPRYTGNPSLFEDETVDRSRTCTPEPESGGAAAAPPTQLFKSTGMRRASESKNVVQQQNRPSHRAGLLVW